VRSFSSPQLMVMLTAVSVLLGVFAARHIFCCEDENRAFVKRSEYVYEIRGEVKRSGFYTYDDPQTIEQLINACGTSKDDIKSIDLNKKLKSGTRLVFRDSLEIENIDAAARINFFLPICINKASSEDIALIPGIGIKTAESMVYYRNKHKGIKDLKELINIRGIGRKKLSIILPYLSL